MESNLIANQHPARKKKRASDEQPQPRQLWGETETYVLIDLWEERLKELRRQKRNSAVYEQIAKALRLAGFQRTRAQVHTKIENLSNTYRFWQKQQTAGSGAIPWLYFRRIGEFLGKLPRNGQNLVHKSTVPTVEQITTDTERGGSSLVTEGDVAPSTSGDESTVAGHSYTDSDSEPIGYAPDDTGGIHEPEVTLLTAPQKRKSASFPELAALLEQLKLMRQDLKAARAKEFELWERQLNMQEKLYEAMMRYFDAHSAQK